MAIHRPALKNGGALLVVFMIFCTTAEAQPTLTTLYSFTGGKDGDDPNGVVIGTGGVLYGSTGHDGIGEAGTVFSLKPPAVPGDPWTGAFYDFYPARGFVPNGVVLGAKGLYGTTYGGGKSDLGTVFLLTPSPDGGGSPTERILHSFSSDGDGYHAGTGVAIGPGGVLCGTTHDGGSLNCGTVFSVTPPAAAGDSWTEAVIHNLDKSDGCGQLDAPLVIGHGGLLYGATETGGPAGAGRVFALVPPSAPGGSWRETVVYDFTGPTDGVYPVGLTIGKDGVLYGSANRGGAWGFGTVFSLTPPVSPGSPWIETTLYSFTGGNDGNSPLSGVVVSDSGTLYGTTGFAGPVRSGNVFSLTPPVAPGGSWTEVSLYNFDGNDGGSPSGLVIGAGGVLYGCTIFGGASGHGTVFAVTP